MKFHSFHEFLKESSEIRYEFLSEAAWQAAFINHVADCVPLTPDIVKLIFDNKKTIAFHVTDTENLLKMASQFKAKNAISCFTYCTEKKLTETKLTPHTKGGILLQLEGNLLFSLNKDSMSKPDPSGRRWILSSNFPAKFQTELQKWLWSKEGGNFDGVELRESKTKWLAFLKKYIPFIESLVEKYAQDIRRYCDMFFSWEDPSDTEQDEDDYNEVVVNQIKIQSVLINKKVFLQQAEESDLSKILEVCEKTLKAKVEIAENEQAILKWFHDKGGVTDYSALIKGKEKYGKDFW
jgi:hypothetical protein